MTDKAGSTDSALAAWASTVMSGDEATESATGGVVARAPGHANYDPADVISVFMTARESAKQRAKQTGGQTGGQTDDVQDVTEDAQPA